jgi:hypothetical protein
MKLLWQCFAGAASRLFAYYTAGLECLEAIGVRDGRDLELSKNEKGMHICHIAEEYRYHGIMGS